MVLCRLTEMFCLHVGIQNQQRTGRQDMFHTDIYMSRVPYENNNQDVHKESYVVMISTSDIAVICTSNPLVL